MCIHGFLKDVLGLKSQSLISKMSDCIELKHIPKATPLVEAGDAMQQLVFLCSGIFRGYLIDVNGIEHTDFFFTAPGDLLMGSQSIYDPSRFTLEALTDCTIMVIPTEKLPPLFAEPEMQQLYIRYLSNALFRYWNLKNLFTNRSAMARYLWFRKTYPKLEDSVSNRYIASFLNMTPVTLSRLRKQLRDRSHPTGQSDN